MTRNMWKLVGRLLPMCLLAYLYLSSAMFYFEILKKFHDYNAEALIEQIDKSLTSDADAETEYLLAVETLQEMMDLVSKSPIRDLQNPPVNSKQDKEGATEAERVEVANKPADDLRDVQEGGSERRKRVRRYRSDDRRRYRESVPEAEGRTAIAGRTSNSLQNMGDKGFREYASSGLKKSGDTLLEQAQERYSGLAVATRRARALMPSVSPELRDRVASLGDDLDTHAFDPLKNAADDAEPHVRQLLQEFEKSISRAKHSVSGWL